MILGYKGNSVKKIFFNIFIFSYICKFINHLKVFFYHNSTWPILIINNLCFQKFNVLQNKTNISHVKKNRNFILISLLFRIKRYGSNVKM